MSTKTIEQILVLASEIRDADQEGENTADRVGSLLVYIAELVEDMSSADESLARTLDAEIRERQALSALLTQLQANLVAEATARQTADGGKTDKDQYTSKLTYSQAPDVVLASMGATLDNAHSSGGQHVQYEPGIGDTYWDSTTGHIKHKKSASTTHDLGEPNLGLVYCNMLTNLTYRWAGRSGWKQVGGSDSAPVNDLTTGGVDVPLSAEMGKVLNERLEDLEDGAGYDISVVGTALVINSRNTPSVSVGEVSNNSVSCKAGGTATASFYVSGRKLTSPVQIAVSDATNWQVSPASISPVDGKVALTLVTITYRPAAGTASGTTHNCTVTVSCGGVTYGTIAMQGTVSAAPSITLTPATLTIGTAENTPATATINVKGVALDGDIALAISGTGFTLSANTVSKADAESAAGADVTVTFDGTASGTATITATSTGATSATASVAGNVVARKVEGDTFTDNGLHYTVLADSTKVSVQQTSTTVPSGAVVIPSSVNDENGIAYSVTEVPNEGFRNNTAITSLTFQEGVTRIGTDAIRGMSNMASLWLPDSLTSLGDNNLHSCTALNNPHIGAGLTALPPYFFASAGSNKTIVIPDNITAVGNYAFNTTQFSSVTIGTGLTYWNKSNARMQMHSGSSVTIRQSTPMRLEGFPFGISTSGSYAAPYLSPATLYVPSDAVATYQATQKWGTADGSGNGMFTGENQIQAIPTE